MLVCTSYQTQSRPRAQEQLNVWPPLGGTIHCRAILMQVAVGMEVRGLFRALWAHVVSASPAYTFTMRTLGDTR